MQEPASIPAACVRGKETRRLRRERVLTTLKGICLQIGRLQHSKEDRLACREVARMLDEALERDAGSPAARRR
ncbi:MAG: hypothetical protein WC661_19995 [Opitutaceae bacterium]|jgi:hypothetical protein